MRKSFYLTLIRDEILANGTADMDTIDRKILALLQDNASLSVAEIGNRVGLSSTPCWKRKG